jgi:hypothetical protein
MKNSRNKIVFQKTLTFSCLTLLFVIKITKKFMDIIPIFKRIPTNYNMYYLDIV